MVVCGWGQFCGVLVGIDNAQFDDENEQIQL